MKKEKHIFVRYTEKKNAENSIRSFTVSIHYYSKGKRRHYTRGFRVCDYKSVGAAKKAAMRHRDEMLLLLESGNIDKDLQSPKYTVNQLFGMVPELYPRSMATNAKNEKVYNVYIKREFGKNLITEIDLVDVQRTLNRCAQRCVQQHVRNLKTVWHRIFQVAIVRGIKVTDWTTVIDTPISKHVTDRSVSEQNISEKDFQLFCAFLLLYGNYSEEDQDKIYDRETIYHLIRVMRITGIRNQEARALSKDKIRFIEGYTVDEKTGDERNMVKAEITVAYSAGSTYTDPNTIKTTKTPWSVRTIPVFDDNVHVIREAMEHSKFDLLFANHEGRPFTSTEVPDFLGRVSKSCGIKVYATLLRKSFASDLYRAGVNPAATKKLMGHKSEDMSVNWYATAADPEIIEAVKNRKYK